MSDEQFQWVYTVEDLASGPIAGIEKALAKLEGRINSVVPPVDKLNKKLNQPKGPDVMKSALAGLGFELFAAQTAFSTVSRAVEETIGGMVDLGIKIFEVAVASAEFQRGTTFMIEGIAGVKEGAGATYDQLLHMAEGTKFTQEQFVEMYERLAPLTKKFGQKATEDILALQSDLAANGPYGEKAAAALGQVVDRAIQTGKLDSRSIRLLNQIPGAGPEEVTKALAEKHGVSVKEIEKMLKHGQISDAEGIDTIMDLIQKDMGGGELGARSKELASGSVMTQLKNVKDHFKNLFSDVDSAPLAHALGTISDLLDPANARGEMIRDTIKELFDEFNKFVDSFASPDKITKYFDTAVKDLQDFSREFKPVLGDLDRLMALYDLMNGKQDESTDKFGLLGASLRFFIDLWAAVGVYALTVWNDLYPVKIIDALIALGPRMVEIGHSIMDGLQDGIQKGWNDLTQNLPGMVDVIPETLRKVLGIHSPSTVMFGLGVNTAEGFNMGLQSAPVPTIQPIQMPSGGGNTNSNTQANHFEINVAVQASGDAHNIAETTAAAIRVELNRMVEGMAIEMGAI